MRTGYPIVRPFKGGSSSSGGGGGSGGGTVTVAPGTAVLLFAKTERAPAGDSVSISSPAGGSLAFATVIPGGIMLADGSGGFYDPATVVGNVFRIRAAGWGEVTNLGQTDNVFTLAIQASGISAGGSVLAKITSLVPATVASGVFRWTIEAELTITAASALAAADGALVAITGVLSGPSLNLTAASGSMQFSFGGAGFEDGGGVAGAIAPLFSTLGTISFSASLFSVSGSGGGDVALGPVTMELLGPPVFNSWS